MEPNVPLDGNGGKDDKGGRGAAGGGASVVGGGGIASCKTDDSFPWLGCFCSVDVMPDVVATETETWPGVGAGLMFSTSSCVWLVAFAWVTAACIVTGGVATVLRFNSDFTSEIDNEK